MFSVLEECVTDEAEKERMTGAIKVLMVLKEPIEILCTCILWRSFRVSSRSGDDDLLFALTY